MNEFKACFEGSATEYTHDDSIDKYKRRIPLFKTCFESLEDEPSPDFVRNCWFICQGYQFNRISPLWDGD